MNKPQIFAICLLVFATSACDGVLEPAAGDDAPLRIAVTGANFVWHFRYPGEDGQLNTLDDVTSERDLALPEGRRVVLEITSEDYLYSFRAPALDLVEIAVPQMTFSLDFTTTDIGRYDLEVDPMCGFNFLHDNQTMGQMLVQTSITFNSWVGGLEKIETSSE